MISHHCSWFVVNRNNDFQEYDVWQHNVRPVGRDDRGCACSSCCSWRGGESCNCGGRIEMMIVVVVDCSDERGKMIDLIVLDKEWRKRWEIKLQECEDEEWAFDNLNTEQSKEPKQLMICKKELWHIYLLCWRFSLASAGAWECVHLQWEDGDKPAWNLSQVEKKY